VAALPQRLRVVEVGPRDGLQNEPAPVPAPVKLAFLAKLVEAGLTQIEATSFVHPRAVPQLADAGEVMAGLPDAPGVVFSALVPNDRGLERALESGVRRVAVFTAASETFTQKNINMTVEESLALFEPLVRRASDVGVSVRGYVSTCFVCPYEGEIDEKRVARIVQRLVELGVDEVAVSDTLGAAAPNDIQRTVGCVLSSVPPERVALHLHDTYGTAVANVVAGMKLGVSTFDASAGGLGGCPFAPGASGNLATEDLVYLADRMGIETGVDLQKVVEAADVVATALDRPLPSRQWRRLRGARGTG